MSSTAIVVAIFACGFAADVAVFMYHPPWRATWAIWYASFFVALSLGYGALCLLWQWYLLGFLYWGYCALMVGMLSKLLHRRRIEVETRILHPVRPEEPERGSASVEFALLAVFLVAVGAVLIVVTSGVASPLSEVYQELVLR